MRLAKFLIIILFITSIALLYVYQQSKILYLAYQEQKKLALLERLVDRRNNLQYNLNRQISLVSIGEVMQTGEFEWPDGTQLVSLSAETRRVKDNNNKYIGEGKREGILSRILGLSSKAEAMPIKAQ